MLINITIGLPVAKFPYICSSPLLTLQAAETCINLHETGFAGLLIHALRKLKKKSLVKHFRSVQRNLPRGMHVTRRRLLPSTARDVVFAMKKEQ